MKIDFKELKRLYDLGLALHWLYPKEKRPIDSRWTTGDRIHWDKLKSTYKPGFNVGVRLGKASAIKLKGTPASAYLAVIDVDAKSGKAMHTQKMEEAFDRLIPEEIRVHAPIVWSGRGNRSRHIYVVTKEPLNPQRIAQSSEIVRVHMPSAKKVSKKEKEQLTEKEINDGFRLRPAWEISLMGEGQQVVLPPSIHPDSGKAYVWDHTADGNPFPPIPLFSVTQKLKEKTEKTIQDFHIVEVDLLTCAISDRVYAQITEGEDVEDRSAALLGVSNAMLKAGMTDDEILTVLTDKGNFLGHVAYEHAQTDSRARAARWLRDYTLEKSKRENSAQEAFKDVVVDDAFEAPKLSPEKAKKQLKELIDEPDWKDELERSSIESGARIKNTLKNVILLLKGEGGQDVYKRDNFAVVNVYGQIAPWTPKDCKVGDEVRDIDVVRIKNWASKKYHFEPSDDRINQAIDAICDENSFHPVQDYLNNLPEWDGVKRIDTWLKDYLNADALEPYLSAVSRKVLVALVKRIFEPGCKFEYVLILEGGQGIGKSTVLKRLVGDKWFSDAHLDLKDKDGKLTLRAKWLIELAELSTLRNADVEALKAFISNTSDRLRQPYGKRSEDFPRQCVFVGTTNQTDYLKDVTGNRRFWPIRVGKCDFDAIERDREQLLAEAIIDYRLGEPTYLEDPEMEASSQTEHSARMEEDTWEAKISDWLEGKSSDGMEVDPPVRRDVFRFLDLFATGGPLSSHKDNKPEIRRAMNLLKKLGFKGGTHKINGKAEWAWARKK